MSMIMLLCVRSPTEASRPERRADAENGVKVLRDPTFLAPPFKYGGLDFPDEEVTVFAA